MRKKFFLFSIILFCTVLFIPRTSCSQSVWSTQYLNNIDGNYLRRVQFINQLTGWACGGSGTLIKTTNGGDSWTVKSTGTTSYLTCLYFIDAKNGLIGC